MLQQAFDVVVILPQLILCEYCMDLVVADLVQQQGGYVLAALAQRDEVVPVAGLCQRAAAKRAGTGRCFCTH